MQESVSNKSFDSVNRGLPQRQQEYLRLFLAAERDVLRYVLSIVPNANDAEEIVQQTAVVLWEKFGDYDPSRPFTPWACRFALNVARQWMARQQRWRRLIAGDLADVLLERRRQLQPVFDARLASLNHCLELLPQRHREIVRRYYFGNQDVQTVARELEKGVEAIYKSLQRIRKRLQECVERQQRLEVGP